MNQIINSSKKLAIALAAVTTSLFATTANAVTAGAAKNDPGIYVEKGNDYTKQTKPIRFGNGNVRAGGSGCLSKVPTNLASGFYTLNSSCKLTKATPRRQNFYYIVTGGIPHIYYKQYGVDSIQKLRR